MNNYENIEIKDLKLAKYNPRQITKDVLDKLKKGLEEYGLVQPIVINKDNTVIGGHQRLKAAEDLGWTEVECLRLDLDKTQEKSLNLALNKLSGDWDWEKLTELLSEFNNDDFDLELTGFDNLEIMDMLDNLESDSLSIEDFDDGSLEDIKDDKEEKNERGYTIQYNLIFNDEEEQKQWNEYLKNLRDTYPDTDTISERVLKAAQWFTDNYEEVAY